MERPSLGPDEVRIASAIESILLVAAEPVTVVALAAAVQEPRARIREILDLLATTTRGGIRLQVHDDQAQLVTAPENVEFVQRFLGSARPPVLSRSALEALTVIAYRQPVTRAEIEAARGVNSDRAVQTLLARGLIEDRGRRLSPGRPLEYGTTFAFLEYFGLSSLDDLPALPAEQEMEAAELDLGLRRLPAGNEKSDQAGA